MESRIKMLREKRGLIQELLAVEIGVTQQMLSKYDEYYGAAEPPVRCGESHLSGLTEPLRSL